MEYVAKIGLEVNGKVITDFKSITEDARVLRKAVKLMNKTGVIKLAAQVGLKLEYAVPKDAPAEDFEEVAGGTITIDCENGTRIKYTGVATLEIGEAKYDGENEVVQVITFTAEKRTK